MPVEVRGDAEAAAAGVADERWTGGRGRVSINKEKGGKQTRTFLAGVHEEVLAQCAGAVEPGGNDKNPMSAAV